MNTPNFKRFLFLTISCACFLIAWCWNSNSWNHQIALDVFWFQLEGNTKVELQRVGLKTEDLEEIVDLYQEVWNSAEYKDSLLIAKKYSKWLGANAFIQDNLEILQNNWLDLANINTTQVQLKKKKERYNAVLLEYEIAGWLIDEIPLLYVSQLFIPKENDIVLVSYITEDLTSSSNISNLFKNIK